MTKCELCKRREYTRLLKLAPLTLVGWKTEGCRGDILVCDVCYKTHESDEGG